MISEVKAIVAGLVQDVMDSLTNTADKLTVDVPANLSKYDDLTDSGYCLIIYAGSKFKENTLIYAVDQERDITISIVVSALKIPGRLSPEEYIDLIIAKLIGTALTEGFRRGGERITMLGDELASEDHGRWTYTLDINVPCQILTGVIV
jgi:hypothetical protein